MGFWDYFRKPQTAKRDITTDQFAALGAITPPTLAGVPVNEQSALTISTFYRACRVKADAVGGIPLKIYRKTSTGRTEANDHPLYPVLHDEPNPESSAVEFWSQMQFWCDLWGNSFAEIERNGAGVPVALWQIHPANVTAGRTEAGALAYEVNVEGEKVIIPAADMLHLKGPSTDCPTMGARLCLMARESLGLTMAMERHGAAYFGNAGRPSLIFSYEGTFTPEEATSLRAAYRNQYGGVANAGAMMLLGGGITATPVQVSNEQGQYVESRRWQCLEICRWVGVDPTLVYDYERATFANSTQQTINFLQFSIDPSLCRIEADLSRKCLSASERGDVYPEFTRESLIRMDPLTQAQVWQIGVTSGWLERNDVRRMLNMEPLPEEKNNPQPPPQQNPQQKDDNGNPQPTN